jgi:cytoskeleton protein RodZ
MAQFEASDGIRIGEVLKETRTRQGLEIRTVEERTKIRIKYLRALENEEWDVLPNHAYAKGFLRTYAQVLELDGDALVDEYRRQVESAGEESYSVGEPVLEQRRRLGEPPSGPPIITWVGVGAVVIVAILLGVGLLGGDDGDDDRADRREARAEKREERRQEQRREQRQQEAQQAAEETIQLRLVMESDVAVCLLGDGERPLIDGQVLLAGNEESFEARRFELRFPSGFDVGQFELFLNGDRRRLGETLGPSAYTITPPDRVRPAPEPGQECP